VDYFVTVLLQIQSRICALKIIKIESYLTKLLKNKKGVVFAPQCIMFFNQNTVLIKWHVY